ncbi:protein bric-a-brac 2-like isoform X1 [Schistocerca gregaria]|uniref:protein bric-a-brac 2-like isoform X1 n=1 Tax=Schistocerca gregaria TaxID=7010 RepID=UPI00211E36D3|nr:protein bric-a-brac 2-like isoform X1 [Schistocerca gregaria]
MCAKPEHYCLKWNNYQDHLAEVFLHLLQAQSLVDVTLCAEGQKIYAHRIVLSACSPYFHELLSGVEDAHPIIILSEMCVEDIQSVIEFVYRGELSVTAERFSSVLKVAEELRIRGLMEVSNHLPQFDDTCPENEQEVIVCDTGEACAPDSSEAAVQSVPAEESSQQNTSTEKKQEEECRKRKRRKESSKKDYSDESMEAALAEIRDGRPLVETAAAHRIPRSTLYVRACAKGIVPTMTRREHSGENVQAAVRAVTGGASLQQAAEQYKIPKTVLWRRVHKEGAGVVLSRRSRLHQGLSRERRQAAIQALERGENLNAVSSDLQIPKKTLYREKARLVEAGRLPSNCIRKRSGTSDACKQLRLNEAVAACQQGKMSQAAASVAYQVPKTAIWRRLQEAQKMPSKNHEQTAETGVNTAMESIQEQPEFSFHDVSTQIPVTYIDESDFHETSLIILTTDMDNGVELQEQNNLLMERQQEEGCAKK